MTDELRTKLAHKGYIEKSGEKIDLFSFINTKFRNAKEKEINGWIESQYIQ